MGRVSETSASADEPRMRVRVCMRRFFADERARAVVLVPVARRVRWLRRRLRALFPLPPRVELLAGRHLLPPDEPLALLARDDLVEVIPRGLKAIEIGLFDTRENSSEVLEAAPPAAVEVTTRDRCTSPAGSWGAAAALHTSDDAFQAADGLGRDVNGSTHDSSDERISDCVAPAAGPRPAADAEQLHHSKLRALELLARHCGAAAETSSEVAPRTRRRRVRRRRRTSRGPSADAGGAPRTQSAERDAREGGVVRGDARARAPRVIHALSPPASCDASPVATVDGAILQ